MVTTKGHCDLDLTSPSSLQPPASSLSTLTSHQPLQPIPTACHFPFSKHTPWLSLPFGFHSKALCHLQPLSLFLSPPAQTLTASSPVTLTCHLLHEDFLPHCISSWLCSHRCPHHRLPALLSPLIFISFPQWTVSSRELLPRGELPVVSLTAPGGCWGSKGNVFNRIQVN